MASTIRCSVASWSWNVDDSETSTSGSVARRRRPRLGAGPRRIVEHGADVAGVVRQPAGEVEVRRRHDQVPAGGPGLVHEVADRRQPALGADLVEPVAALVPDPLHHGQRQPVTGPPERSPGRLRARPDRRHPRRREHVDVRHQDVERDAGGLGRGHRPERELRADHQVGTALGDRGVDVGDVAPGRSDELQVEQPVEQLQRAGDLPVPVRIVLGPAVGPVGGLDPRAERRARWPARRAPSSPRRGRSRRGRARRGGAPRPARAGRCRRRRRGRRGRCS